MIQNEINKKINQIILKCSSDQEIYRNIMQEFFLTGIDKQGPFLKSLEILPKLQDKELQNKFKQNKEKIISYIKGLAPELDIYKILSCIYGAFVGDAVGGFCEFHKSSYNNCKKIFKDYPVFGQLPGQITDDSEMSMCCAYAIMDNPEKESIDVNYLYFYYGAWSKSNPIDMGYTTIQAFKKYNFKDFLPKNQNFKSVQEEIFNKNYDSLSNGFLMRKNTLIAWIYYRFYGLINNAFSQINNNKDLVELYEKIKNFSYVDNECTHPNLEANSVSAFYCIMALGAIKGLSANNIIDKIYYLCKDKYFLGKGKDDDDRNLAVFIISYIDIFKDLNFNLWNFFTNTNSYDCITKNIGYYGHSLKLTLYYLVKFDMIDSKDRYKTIMDEICNLGGDTDTNCCIVGAVIGPLIGFKNFGHYFDIVIDVIPRDRYLFSICIMLLYVLYLKKSNKDDELINDEFYFLRTILTLLYDDLEIEFS